MQEWLNDQMSRKVSDSLAIQDVSYGRGLFSKRKRNAGALLASLEPHCVVLDSKALEEYCSFCFRAAPLHHDGTRAALLRCSGCRIAKFCSADCHRQAWKPGEHKEECGAFKRLKLASKDADYVPSTPVRALGRLLWRKALHAADWWTEIDGLQSHRSDMSQEAQAEMGKLAQQLGVYVGADVVRQLSSAHIDEASSLPPMYAPLHPIPLAQQGQSFAFTNLSNVGVCLCPMAALSNHDCSPNAVVVFPEERKSPLHIVALRPIAEGEEILTSYVDLSLPRRLRQKELKARYYFDCACDACSRPSNALDPRKALRCPVTDCKELSNVPPLCHGEAAKVVCAAGHETMFPSSLVDEVTSTKVDNVDSLSTKQLETKRQMLERYLPDTSSPLFAILRVLQDRALSEQFASAIPLASRVAGAMDKLYERGHPARGIQLATLGKLMLNTESGPSPSAVFVLRRALSELEIGFGGTGESLMQTRRMLHEAESFVRATAIV